MYCGRGAEAEAERQSTKRYEGMRRAIVSKSIAELAEELRYVSTQGPDTLFRHIEAMGLSKRTRAKVLRYAGLVTNFNEKPSPATFSKAVEAGREVVVIN